MVSSSVRICGCGRALSGTVSSLIAPPFQRSTRSARRAGRGRGARVMLTSSSRVRSSCLRSLSVVVGASTRRPRSSPRARIAALLAAAVRVFGRAVSRRASSASASASSLQRGLPFGFQAAGDQPVVRVDGPVAALGPGGVVAGLLDLAALLGQRGVVAVLRAAGRLPGRPAARRAAARPGTRRRRRRRWPAPPTRRCRVPRPSTSWPVPVQ